MEDITSKKGEAHVTSTQFRAIVESLAGVESYIASVGEELEPELSTNNTVIIRPGILIHHGHVIQVPPNTYDTVNYLNGSQGMKRIDLVVARYTRDTSTGNENTDWVVIQGEPDATTPVAPDYTMGNMQEGDLVDDCPVFELHFDGINVTSIEKILETFAPINEIADKIYPIGTVYKNTKDVNPNKLFGGVWSPIEDVFLIGAGGDYAVNATGGAKTIDLTHSHTVNSHAHTGPSHQHIGTFGFDENSWYVGRIEGSSVVAVANAGNYIGYAIGANLQSVQTSPIRLSNTSFSGTGNTGKASPGTNSALSSTQSILPPYRAVYMWERIA